MTSLTPAYEQRHRVLHSWQALIVDHLRESKAAGDSFSVAWSIAVHAVKIPERDDYEPQLFTSTGGETVAGFFRRVCEKAYEGYVGAPGSGDGPALRHFSVDMVDDDVRLDPVMAA